MANDQTEARRKRVRTLWIRTDRQIAEILLEEGYGGAIKRTADARHTQLASMQRNVWNDRVYWRKEWRKLKRATSEQTSESKGEYLATLDSLQDVGVEILSDPKMKGTPKVQALMAVTRIQEARAKATGVAETEVLEPEGDDDRPRAPFIGVVVGLANVSADAQSKIKTWNKKHGRGAESGE